MEYKLIHSAVKANIIYVVEPEVRYVRMADATEINDIIGVLHIDSAGDRISIRRHGELIGNAISVPNAIVALFRYIERES